MRKKICAAITLLILGGTILFLAVADILTPDKKFSSYENRMLAAKPKFSFEALFKGSYTGDYETYVTDQFVGRNRWIAIKTGTDVALGKKEINGVYLAKDGSLIEKHAEEDISAETEEAKLALLEKLAKEYEGRVQVMLVPTADNILTEKLPAHAEYYDQLAFIDKVTERLSDDIVINVADALKAHKDEYIYYKTDHHWTTLGAYYGYLAWAEKMGVTPVSYDVEQVAEEFLGTLHSKTNLPVASDTIKAYRPTGAVRVSYDFGQRETDSLYEAKHLDTKNKYGYFLDDNHPFIEIQTGTTNPKAQGKKLFVIKDSYANCFVPFLTEHYETIYVLDLRFYNAPLFDLIDLYETPILDGAAGEGTEADESADMDILVLYNVIHFMEEFRYR